MKRSQLTEEVFKMRFTEINDRFQKKQLSCEEAADLLAISLSTFYRKRQRSEEEGFAGNFDKRLGRLSPHRAADYEVECITQLYNQHYLGFSVKHFYEFAQREHQLTRSYNWTRLTLENKGVIKKSTRGGKHRLRRERKAMVGMMIHQDGSTHRWIPALDFYFDLIVTMDDATSEITSAFLVEEEGVLSSFQGIHETVEKYGLFCSFYTDRGSHYFYTPKAGEKVDKTQLTQVGRALRQLGIRHIPAYSPEARGRSERMFGTLQNRLPKELALYNITNIEDANRYIRDVYLPRHNKQFSVKPACSESAFVPWASTISIKEVLCIQEDRTVQKDNTIHYENLILQIPKNEFRQQYIKAKVKIRKYADSSLAAFYGPLCIGRYDKNGNLIQNEIAKNNKGALECAS
jgi:transposase